MLVLTRRVNESLIIDFEGKSVEVFIRGIVGNQVRMSFDADKKIKIDRKEIFDKKMQNPRET